MRWLPFVSGSLRFVYCVFVLLALHGCCCCCCFDCCLFVCLRLNAHQRRRRKVSFFLFHLVWCTIFRRLIHSPVRVVLLVVFRSGFVLLFFILSSNVSVSFVCSRDVYVNYGFVRVYIGEMVNGCVFSSSVSTCDRSIRNGLACVLQTHIEHSHVCVCLCTHKHTLFSNYFFLLPFFLYPFDSTFFSVYILFISHFSLGEFWFCFFFPSVQHLTCLEGAAAAVPRMPVCRRINMQWEKGECTKSNQQSFFFHSLFKYKIAACACAIRDLVLALKYNGYNVHIIEAIFHLISYRRTSFLLPSLSSPAISSSGVRDHSVCVVSLFCGFIKLHALMKHWYVRLVNYRAQHTELPAIRAIWFNQLSLFLSAPHSPSATVDTPTALIRMFKMKASRTLNAIYIFIIKLWRFIVATVKKTKLERLKSYLRLEYRHCNATWFQLSRSFEL